DIACVDIGWTIAPDDGSTDVSFRMIESMRFNRAGDRISHLIATALVDYLKEKHGIEESLDFLNESQEAAFTLTQKRLAVSKISALASACKQSIARPQTAWTLSPEDELELVGCFAPLLENDNWQDRARQRPHFHVDEATLAEWLTADSQSLALETNG